MTTIVPFKCCMPVPGVVRLQGDHVRSALAIDVEFDAAGGEHVDNVGAGAGVEGY